MIRKLAFISIFVVLGISGIIFISKSSLKDKGIGFLGGADSRVDVSEQEEVPPDISPEIRFQYYPTAEEKAARMRLHPLACADEAEIAAYEKQPISTWEEWLDGTTELALGTLVGWGRFKTLEEVEAQRQKSRAHFAAKTAELRATEPPPKDLQLLPMFIGTPPKPEEPERYQGPQTPAALIAEYDEAFMESVPESTEWDTHFPKAAFLQRVLDRDYEVKEKRNYTWALTLRRDLINLKEKPDRWRAGYHGIPITTDYEEYVDGYIDRKIWEHDIAIKVSEENPRYAATAVFFPSSHPDKYLPQAGNITYVRQRSDGAMRTYGAPLTKEQRDNLLYEGKQPEEIEIVFIDDDYNVLSKPPEPFDYQKWREENSYDVVPQGLRAPSGSILTPEQYQDFKGTPMSAEMLQRYYEYTETEPPVDVDGIRAAAREAAAAERERFQEGLRELERFSNMSDAEIEAELERRLLPQMPELPTAERIENQLWSEVQSSVMTPARFEAALKILEQYGPEEGMQRLSKADPKAAAQVQRIIGIPPDTEPPPTQQRRPEPQDKDLLPDTNP